MPRRRWTFRRFLKRRWRFAGFTLVLMAAALLVLVQQDRGHDPLWTERPGDVAQLALDPEARATYVLTREVLENTTERNLHAYARDGSLLWTHAVQASSLPTLTAGDGWVATATPFPGAALIVHDLEGNLLYQEFLEGTPRALAADGDRLAIALRAPGNPVLVYDNWTLERMFPNPSVVISLDLSGPYLAAGTDRGNLVVRQGKDVLLNVTHGISIRSVRLDANADRVLAGGFNLAQGSLSGAAHLYDLRAPGGATAAWSRETGFGVGFVDLDADGDTALLLEESSPRYVVHALDADTGNPLWNLAADGIVSRDGGGSQRGGIALSPDGATVALTTFEGPVRLLDAQTGDERWRFQAEGSTFATFPEARPGLLAANARLVPNRPYDAVLLFDVTEEPFTKNLGLFAPTLLALIALAGFGGLGAWYAIDRRQ